MFSVPISVVLVVFFVSQGQSTTTLAPMAGTVTIAPSAQTSIREPPASTTAMAPSPSSISSLSTSASIPPPEKPSCVLVSFIAERAWNASLSERKSVLYNKTSENITKAVTDFFNERSKYEDVEVSEHEYSKTDSVTLVKMKLCLVVKTSDGPLIDAVLIDKLKNGYLFDGFEVRKDSAEFKPLGVEFKDLKVKDGECAKCEGAAGEFTIEGTCVPKESSCKGLKNTMMTKDCVTYCDSSAGAYTVSFLILAMGLFFSFSFQ